MTGLLLPKREINRRFYEKIEAVNCDHAPSILELGPCRKPADLAPRLLVPSKTQSAPGHKHLHVDFLDLHFCDVHQGEVPIEQLLDRPRMRGNIEAHAKKVRPIDFKCDFDAAHLVYVSIFTPEYKYFEVVKHLMPRGDVEQAWGTMVAHG